MAKKTLKGFDMLSAVYNGSTVEEAQAAVKAKALKEKELKKAADQAEADRILVDNNFINPYNFVPLPSEHKLIFNVDNDERNLSGYIECKLIPMSDIFIPNTSNDRVFSRTRAFENCTISHPDKHKSFEFYSYNNIEIPYDNIENTAPDEPVIPGSEIRGVIRSAYEVLTNSCLSVINENQRFSSRTTMAMKPGLLSWDNVNNTGSIRPAKRYMLNNRYNHSNHGNPTQPIYRVNNKTISIDGVTYRTGDNISFTEHPHKFVTIKNGNRFEIPLVKSVVPPNTENPKRGYLFLGEPFVNKHHESIFEPLNGNIDVSHNDYKRMLTAIKDYYREKKVNKDRSNNGYMHINYEGALENLPIWYEKIGDVLYISPAAIGRQVYQKTQKDLLGDYLPCNSKSSLCYACSLFGTVNTDFALTSKVRFTDAQFNHGNDNLKPDFQSVKMLDKLMGPKNSSYEFYLDIINPPNNTKYWTPDYYRTGNANGGVKHEYNDDTKIKIRGRKYYWHGTSTKYLDDQAACDILTGQEQGEFNSTIRALKARSDENHNEFNFKVYYDNLSETELKHLIFSLNLGSNSNDNCHKIGKGKPLGLGSIKIKVEKVYQRKLVKEAESNKIIIQNTDSEISEIEYNGNGRKPEALICDDVCFRAYKRITSLSSLNMLEKQMVKYPFKTIGNPSYEWFAANRQKFKLSFAKTLPKLEGNNQKLPSNPTA